MRFFSSNPSIIEYYSSYCEYRFNEFSRQIEFIRRGLYSVVPGYYLNLFTATELEESICRKSEIDIEILKRNTQYGGSFNEDSLHVQRRTEETVLGIYVWKKYITNARRRFYIEVLY